MIWAHGTTPEPRDLGPRQLDAPQRASRSDGRPAARPGWRGARPELAIAVLTVLAAAAAADLLAGPWALVVVATAAAGIALLVLRGLVPPTTPAASTGGGEDRRGNLAAFRYWHYLGDLRDGMESRAAYESRLRPVLEHLLAARLAQRHDVNLYREPQAAWRLVCPGGRDRDLWPWIDPAQAGVPAEAPAGHRAEPPGIPGRVLARLINRLEEL